MRKALLAALVSVAPATLLAKSAVDAMQLSQSELRGTARFMSMAGAFTALGGDLSTLGQNPAGIGIYRGNDVGFTLGVNMMTDKTTGVGQGSSVDNTNATVNNTGYVGSFNLGDDVFKSISFGVSYGRMVNFDRSFRGGAMPMQTSLSNYVTTFTDGIPASDMTFSTGYNQYENMSSNAPSWLSILSYTGGLITPIPDAQGEPTTNYNGLWEYNAQPTTSGQASFNVREKGYVDEYNIDFGGNLANTVYWGLGIGITDLSFTQRATYGEDLTNANVPNAQGNDVELGNGGFTMSNWKNTHGTGVNVKFGLIFKPVNELRLGFAIHSPTYYNLTTSYNADVASRFSSGFQADPKETYTNDAYYDWKLQSPWKMMFGVAGVIGGKGIVSVDYEYQAFNDMKTQDADGMDYEYYNDNIKDYCQSSNTVRLGLEYRLTPQFSLRAGYAYTDANTKKDVRDSNIEVVTSGTNAAYTLDNKTQYVTAGLGYRYKGFYADFAYVYKNRESTYHAFASFKDYDGYWTDSPKAKLTSNTSQLVFTLGFKF